MFTVLDHGTQVFTGWFSEMNAFLIDNYGSHQAALLAGVRITPPPSKL